MLTLDLTPSLDASQVRSKTEMTFLTLAQVAALYIYADMRAHFSMRSTLQKGPISETKKQEKGKTRIHPIMIQQQKDEIQAYENL